MKARNYEFHTHQLKEEKNLKIVIKGIPTEITEVELEEELKEEGYPTANIKRMNGRRGTPIQMVPIEIERKYKSLYDNKKLCHRCQLFGRIQKNCNATYNVRMPKIKNDTSEMSKLQRRTQVDQ
jgi:hypothetical protein